MNFLLWTVMGQALIVDPEGSEEEVGVLRPFKSGGVFSSTLEALPQILGNVKC